MTDLTDLQARLKRLGRIAKWGTALSLIIPTLLFLTAIAVAAVVLTVSNPLDIATTAVAVFAIFPYVACTVFWVLRRGAQDALAEAEEVRSSIATALAPTNAGKLSPTQRFLERQRIARAARGTGQRSAETRKADVQRSTRGDDGNTLLSSILSAFDSAPHRSHSDSSHHTQSAHTSYDHGSTHSHSSFDHGSHSSFDGGSFSDGGGSF